MGKKILIDVTERGRNGGKARAANMDTQQRSEAARRAVTVRWDRVRAKAARRLSQAAARKIQRANRKATT